MGPALNQPEYIDMLMQPLTARWASLDDTDPDLIPLLECMASVTIAMGPGFQPHAVPVFQRCVNIIHQNLVAYEQAMTQPSTADDELPDRTFLIVALDLLSGLCQGLGVQSQELVANVQPLILPQLLPCLTNIEPPVRQSAFALLGDLAINAFPQLKPYLPTHMPLILSQISPEQMHETLSVCNNATWAAGEIALQSHSDPDFQVWVPELLTKLMAVLMHPKCVKSLSENAAVTIGRLGLVATSIVAQQLPVFIEPWCQALWDIKDNDEKESAFLGLCLMIHANPNGATAGFAYFCNAVVRWTKPSERLNNEFQKVCAPPSRSGWNW